MIEGKTDREKAERVFAIFKERLDGEVQGACAVIAMNIWGELTTDSNDPVVVGGYLASATGWKRAHWWIEKSGVIFDPMGDEYRNEPGFHRITAHRGEWGAFCAEYRRQRGNLAISGAMPFKHCAEG